MRAALLAGAKAGPRLVTRAVAQVNSYSRVRNNGWLVSLGYIGDYGRNYLGRAVIARFALGANTAPETVYPSAVTDSRGRPLSGRHRYRIRFARGKLPPADAFWSITMYDERRLPPPNAARRYAIGDRTPGLRRGRDGSLTLTLQNARPAGAAAANWLPAPEGALPHDHAGLRAAQLGAQAPLAASARGPPQGGVARPGRGLDSTLRARGTKDSREEGPSRSPVRRGLRRWDAADGQPLHRRHGDGGERPRDAAGLPGRDPRPCRHPARRLRLPDPLRLARHPHAGRPPQRARGDEPGRPDHEPRRRSRRAAP